MCLREVWLRTTETVSHRFFSIPFKPILDQISGGKQLKLSLAEFVCLCFGSCQVLQRDEVVRKLNHMCTGAQRRGNRREEDDMEDVVPRQLRSSTREIWDVVSHTLMQGKYGCCCCYRKCHKVRTKVASLGWQQLIQQQKTTTKKDTSIVSVVRSLNEPSLRPIRISAVKTKVCISCRSSLSMYFFNGGCLIGGEIPNPFASEEDWDCGCVATPCSLASG